MADKDVEVAGKYSLVREEKGILFWKKRWAIYRAYSYVLGEQTMSGQALIGRYKTVVDAVESYKSFGHDTQLNILGMEV